MSLPQLIGEQCVACQKSISSIIDGVFCDACGNPVHRKCISSVQQVEAPRCTRCGGDPATAVAQEVRRERLAPAQTVAVVQKSTDSQVTVVSEPQAVGASGKILDSAPGKSRGRGNIRLPEPDTTVPFPVSEKCPKCSSTQFTRIQPQRMIAFVKDRVCNQCGTRYTPPTPLWAALVFILLGIFFFGGGLGNLLVGDNPRITSSIFGMIFGVTALIFGMRAFSKPGKV